LLLLEIKGLENRLKWFLFPTNDKITFGFTAAPPRTPNALPPKKIHKNLLIFVDFCPA